MFVVYLTHIIVKLKKIFMKQYVNFIICSLFILLLTGCEKEEELNPGEIAGKEIQALVDSWDKPTRCEILNPKRNEQFTFKIEGQFLKLQDVEGVAFFDPIFDLNNLVYYQPYKNYNSSYNLIWFYFN